MSTVIEERPPPEPTLDEDDVSDLPKDKSVGWVDALGEHAANPPMAKMSDNVLHALGLQWQVSADENRIKGQFEAWVRRNARLTIHLIEDEDGPEEAAKERDVFQKAMGRGAYNWRGEAIRAAMKDAPGLQHLLYLMILRCHPEGSKQPITEQLVEEMYDESMLSRTACIDAISWSLGNFPSRLKKLAQVRERMAKASAAADGAAPSEKS